MPLGEAVQGSLRPTQRITWTDAAGVPLDITGATLSGTIAPAGGAPRAITGALVVVDGAAGIFDWQYSAADVIDAGQFTVQFTAVFPGNPTPARTRRAGFEILLSQ